MQKHMVPHMAHISAPILQLLLRILVDMIGAPFLNL